MSSERPLLEVEGLSVCFPGTAPDTTVSALDGIDLSVATGETVALLGPSGCGKTTLLRVVAGLEAPTAGRVLLDGDDLTGVAPHRRGLGLMFQDYALFPHRDVAGNVEFGLRMHHVEPAARRARVEEVLELVGLPGFASRDVGRLSGGERQRVALARALAPAPRLLMLDEPLGSLDRSLRERLVLELQALFAELGLTVLYVTHDQGEALALADRMVVMSDGRIAQVGRPREVWASPANEFVARFFGLVNIVDAVVAQGRVRTGWGLDVAYPPSATAPEGPVRVLIRPEAIGVTEAAGPTEAVVPPVRASVAAVVFRGDRDQVRLTVAPGVELEAAIAGGTTLSVGATVGISLDPAGIRVLSPGESAQG